ncbi:MAG: hypothetical protein AAB434_08535 [Planctomycetota bacterium]
MHHATQDPDRHPADGPEGVGPPRSLPLLLVGTLLVLGLTPPGAIAGERKAGQEWQTWKDDVRNILKIEYRAGENDSYELKIYKNKDWNGNGDEFDHIDSFTISKEKPHHKASYPKFYPSLAGPIDVEFEITADYKARKVHNRGSVTSPDPQNITQRTEKKWDQDFFSMPTSDNIIITHKDGYDFDEVSEVWTAFCSDFACGSWVSFPGYTEAHRYDVEIPGIGKVIVQLWKGKCPRFSDMVDTDRLKKYHFGGKYPGGVGAEVGVYRPKGNGSMIDAAGQDQWVPVVDPKLRISFRLVNPKDGKVLVEAEEKNTWWRTKWITMESFESYKKSSATPENLLEYELHYTINGVEQPVWKYSGDPGRYPLGWEGIWQRPDTSKQASVIGGIKEAAGAPDLMEFHRAGQSVRMTWDNGTPLALTLSGAPVSGTDARGNFEVSAKESGDLLTLDFVYDSPVFTRTIGIHFDEALTLTVTGFGPERITYLPK